MFWGKGACMSLQENVEKDKQKRYLDRGAAARLQWVCVLAVVPNCFVWSTPTALSDELKYPFIDTTCHVPNVFNWTDFPLDII